MGRRRRRRRRCRRRRCGGGAGVAHDGGGHFFELFVQVAGVGVGAGRGRSRGRQRRRHRWHRRRLRRLGGRWRRRRTCFPLPNQEMSSRVGRKCRVSVKNNNNETKKERSPPHPPQPKADTSPAVTRSRCVTKVNVFLFSGLISTAFPAFPASADLFFFVFRFAWPVLQNSAAAIGRWSVDRRGAWPQFDPLGLVSFVLFRFFCIPARPTSLRHLRSVDECLRTIGRARNEHRRTSPSPSIPADSDGRCNGAGDVVDPYVNTDGPKVCVGWLFFFIHARRR